MHHLSDVHRARSREKVLGAFAVHGPEEMAVLGERHLCDVVEHGVDAPAGVCDGIGVSDVCLHELDVCRTVVRIDAVERTHLPARFDEPVSE